MSNVAFLCVIDLTYNTLVLKGSGYNGPAIVRYSRWVYT